MAITTIAGVPLEEYGDTMKIAGVIVSDGHKVRSLYLPGEVPEAFTIQAPIELTLEEATAWLYQSDNPIMPIQKAIVRKAHRHVDQNIAWAVYARAGYTCEYCGRAEVVLTYDHILARKYGGKTTLDNGAAACRPCNKAKGHMTIKDWVSFMIENQERYTRAGDWAIWYAKTQNTPN